MPCAIHAFAKDVLNLGPRLGGDQRLGRNSWGESIGSYVAITNSPWLPSKS